MAKKAQARRRRKSAKRARRAIVRAAKAVAALMAVFAAGAIGAATSRQISTTARALAGPVRDRLSRAWHSVEGQFNGASGTSER
jgi:hypothetical protein